MRNVKSITRTELTTTIWNETTKRYETATFVVSLNVTKLPRKVLLKAFHNGKASALYGAFKVEKS